MAEPLQPLVNLPLRPDVRVCWEEERGGVGSEWSECNDGRVMVGEAGGREGDGWWREGGDGERVML